MVIALNYLRNRTGLSADTLIGVFLSMSLALGASILLVLAGRINIHILENVLVGSILTVSGMDIVILAGVGLAVLTLTLTILFFNRFVVASFNPTLAAVRGVPVKALDYLFVMLVTVVTVASVKIIGAILVGALLVIPAATARTVSSSLKSFVALSVLFALIATIAGILIPMELDLPIPSGAAIILSAGILFLGCTAAQTLLPALKGDTA